MNIVERNSRFKLIKKILFGIGLILILFIGVALEVNIRKNYEVMSIDKHEVEELQKLAPSSSGDSDDDVFAKKIEVGKLQGVDKFYCPESMNFSTPWRISAAKKGDEVVKPQNIMFCREYNKSFIISNNKGDIKGGFRVSNGQQYAEYVKDGDSITLVPQSIAYYNYYFPIQTDYYSDDESDIDSRYYEKDAIDRSRQLVIWTADSWKGKANTNSLPGIEDKINIPGKDGKDSSYTINGNKIEISGDVAKGNGRNELAETRAIQYANFRYFALKENEWKGTDSGFSTSEDNAKFNVKLGIRLVDAEKVKKEYFVYPDNEHKEEYDRIINNNTLSTSNKEELTNGYLNDQNDYENKGLVDISSSEITSQNTRCLVDNEKNEYLFGPYMLSFDNMNYEILNSGMKAGTLTYNEITKQNHGQNIQIPGMIDANNTFCYGSFKSTIIRQGEDENSSTLTTSAIHTNKNQFDVNYNEYSVGSDGTGFEIIYTDDGTKEKYNFPQFGRSFYIKYKSKDEEIPVRNIKIEARVKYTKYIHMRAQKYKAVAVYANPGETTVPEDTTGDTTAGRSIINDKLYSWSDGIGVYKKQQIDKAGVEVGDSKYIELKWRAGQTHQQTLAGERVFYDSTFGNITFAEGNFKFDADRLTSVISRTTNRYKRDLGLEDKETGPIMALNMGFYIGFTYKTNNIEEADSYEGRIYLFDNHDKKVSKVDTNSTPARIIEDSDETNNYSQFDMRDELTYTGSTAQDVKIKVRHAQGTDDEKEKSKQVARYKNKNKDLITISLDKISLETAKK